MTGENGAERVKKYSVPMAEGMAYNFASKKVDDNILEIACACGFDNLSYFNRSFKKKYKITPGKYRKGK